MGSCTSRPVPWTDLPPDLILAVSARLQHPADIVRFHAVCRPWRDAAALLSPAAAATSCLPLPWLLTSRDYRMVHSIVDFRHPSRSNDDIVLPEPPGAQATTVQERTRNRVASADGTAAWFLVAGPDPKLIDIFTSLLYSFRKQAIRKTGFTAAIMRPGDTSWTVMEKRLATPRGRSWKRDWIPWHEEIGRAWVHLFYYIFSDHDENNNDHERSYMLESQGEILWASVLMKDNRGPYGYDYLPYILRVTVRALQKAAGSGEMRWVAKDGQSLGNRILFLGSPASFSAQLLDNAGNSSSSAYFAFEGSVFRYNFVDDESELVKWMPIRLSYNDACAVWLRPKLTFASVHEIQERLEAQKKARSISKLRRVNHYFSNSIVVLSRNIRQPR
uniref:F-box domain-containing protein n=1 Tax=Aegilops tauschii TaxID=37682 RepID=M8D5N6_AEGTA